LEEKVQSLESRNNATAPDADHENPETIKRVVELEQQLRASEGKVSELTSSLQDVKHRHGAQLEELKAGTLTKVREMQAKLQQLSAAKAELEDQLQASKQDPGRSELEGSQARGGDDESSTLTELQNENATLKSTIVSLKEKALAKVKSVLASSKKLQKENSALQTALEEARQQIQQQKEASATESTSESSQLVVELQQALAHAKQENSLMESECSGHELALQRAVDSERAALAKLDSVRSNFPWCLGVCGIGGCGLFLILLDVLFFKTKSDLEHAQQKRTDVHEQQVAQLHGDLSALREVRGTCRPLAGL